MNNNDNPHPGPYPNAHEREFITAARLLMICGLVYHHLFEIPGSGHSPRRTMEGVEHFVPELLNSFFHMAMMTAVPVLSIISGFLFFRRPVVDFSAQLKSRAKTVALPTWLWSALWLGFAWLLYTLSRNTGLFPWANYGFDDPGVMTMVNGVFGITQQPLAFQFWFVHDLLITLLLTPVLYFFLKLLGWRLLIVAAVLWLLVPDPPLYFSANVPMFFAIGAWLAMPRSPGLATVLLRLQPWRWILTGLFALALLLRLFAHLTGGLSGFLQGYEYLCVLRVLGVIAVAALLSRYAGREHSGNDFVHRYGGYAFFIFAVHYPLIELVQVLVPLIPAYATATGLVLTWLLVPLATIALAIALARLCDTRAHALFLALNGGRSATVPADRVRADPGQGGKPAGKQSFDYHDPAPDTR